MSNVPDWTDKLNAGELPADILDCAIETPASNEAPRVKPTIHVRGGELPEQVEAAAAALLQYGEPIFDFAGSLVIVQRRQRAGKSAGVPVRAEQIKPGRLKYLLAKVASWTKTILVKSGFIDVQINPPPDVGEALLHGACAVFPPLTRIVTTPFLLPDGEVVTTPGYHADSGLFFDPCGVTFPPISDAPTREDALVALDVLKDVLHDFPFPDEAARGAALAAIMTPVVRSAVEGPVPLFLVRAHVAGTGKGKLVNVAGVIATGASVPCMAAVEETEFEKRIVSALLGGQSMLLIDNVSGKIGSATLDALLTTEGDWSGRMLGKSETVNLPMQLVVYVTGNNPSIRGDLSRRCIPVSLESKVERPEHRTGFRYPKLLAHVKKHRPELVMAILTISKAYLAASSPEVALQPLGSFEAWTELVRAPLVWLGCDDPVAGQESLRTDADESLAGWRAALALLFERFKDQPFTAAHVADESQAAPSGLHAARDVLAALSRKGEVTGSALGVVFKRRQGQILDGLRLRKVDGGRQGAGNLWVIDRVV